jgi:hypothetical protein
MKSASICQRIAENGATSVSPRHTAVGQLLLLKKSLIILTETYSSTCIYNLARAEPIGWSPVVTN